MITDIEFEQIKWALGCMNGYIIDSQLMINSKNVIGLLERYKESAYQPIKEEKESGGEIF
jgi:hypothetical protein